MYSHFNYTINQFHTVGYGGKRMADNYDNGDKDRRELLKLKQGLVDEKDSNIKETGYDVRMAQTPGEKTKNFLWYHKVMIVVGILLIALAAVIYAEFFVKKKPDITIYSLGNYAMSIRTGFEEGMSAYTPDFDNNGEHNVTIDQGVPDQYLGDVDLFDQIKTVNVRYLSARRACLRTLTTASKRLRTADIQRSVRDNGRERLSYKSQKHGIRQKDADLLNGNLCCGTLYGR